MKIHQKLRAVCLGLCVSFAPAAVLAQSYPSKPIRIVVPYPAGGATDVLARTVSSRLAPKLGQPVVVENRAGASGNIGLDHVAKSQPDGYTIVMSTGNMTIAPAFGELPFDPVKDFAPITTVIASQNIITARQDLPVTNLQELISLARAEPDRLTHGSSGVGTPLMAMELLKGMTNIQVLNIPYKGDAPALADLLGGQIDVYASPVLAAAEHIKAGRLKGLAVTGSKRSGALPDLPTVAEAGVPGYELVSWFGLLAPAGTPGDVINLLNKEVAEIIAQPDVQQQIRAGGAEPWTVTPDEFAMIIKTSVEKYATLVRDFNITLD